jgi:glycosyltransferase involved in cell wall biosynthesis
MRIVTLINGLNNGGAEKFAVELCNELSRKHDVYLLVKQPIEPFMIPPRIISNGVHLIEFHSSKKWDIMFLWNLLKTIFRLKPEVIHIHSSLLVFYTILFPCFFRQTKIYQTIHNEVTPAYVKVLKWIQAFGFLGIKLRQITISEKIRRDFQKIFPRLSFTVIENGVKALESFRSQKKEGYDGFKRLLAIGHFGPAKRFDLLADALESPMVSPSYKLEILGEEKDPARPVTAYILSKKMDNVSLLGLKENVADYLANADALVISSSFEGMPLVMLEALSLGCPIISTPVGGIPDVIVPGVNGVLTKGLLLEDLVEALLHFDRLSSGQVNQIRENNRRLFHQRFGIDTCAQKYEDLFLSMR